MAPSQGVLDNSSQGQESGLALRARDMARGEDKKFWPHELHQVQFLWETKMSLDGFSWCFMGVSIAS